MKITVVCDVLGEANNGTSLAAYNLIKYLKKCGHDVSVISPDGPSGEGFVRVSYAYSLKHLQEALRRMENFVNRHQGESK